MRVWLITCLLALVATCVIAQTLDPTIDYRAGDTVVREADGSTKRNTALVSAFRALYPCPSTRQKTGACPGWAVDHVIPLACGGVDAVYNMQWLPDEIKSKRGPYSKDHFERRVYGGKNAGPGCP